MTAVVAILSQKTQRFEEVEGFSFYSGRDNNTGLAVARWTKYQEEGRGSEDFVNLDPTLITVSCVESIYGELHAYAQF